MGPVFKTVEPLQIYGVAVLTNDAHSRTSPNYPEGLLLRVKVAQKDESGVWRIVDSAQWHETGPERYFRYPLHPCDTTLPDSHHVSPVFEVYFNHPVTVFDTFAVGTGWGEDLYTPLFNTLVTCPDTRDTLPGRLLEINPNNNYIELTGGFYVQTCSTFPILVPPDTDSYVCAGVDSVRVQGSGTGWVNVAWAPGSEDQELFQIAYGVRGEDPFQYASVINQESPRVIFDDAIDTGVYYSVRVRGRCHHRCAVHDTLMWGPWSELVHFYVGNYEPGTGIAAPEEIPAFSLTPNPTTGEVTIEVKGERWKVRGGEMTVTVCDASGREVRRQTLASATEDTRLRLDLRGLPAGAYFVTLTTLQGSHTEKLVMSDQ